MVRHLTVSGLNHKSAPIEVREKLSVGSDESVKLLHEAVNLPTVEEAVLLSTCNRVEIVTCCDSPGSDDRLLELSLFRGSGIDSEQLHRHVYTFNGRDAVRHVFRVASSLDSMVVGEPQILGQMKDQFSLSSEHATTGTVLNRLFHKSFSVAKRVRNETRIASRSVSVASAAVDLAGKIFETLEGRTVLLAGLGEIGEVAVRHLLAAGVDRIMVANRTLETAVDLARELGGTPLPLDRMDNYLPLADLVIGAAGGGQLLGADRVRAIMKERQYRAVFFIDLAVPRNFDPAINDIDGAYLYDVDDLEAVVEDNLDERQREAVRAEAIVEEEVDNFWRWLETLNVVPTIVDLRERAESIRQYEVSRTLQRLETLDVDERERVEQMSRAIVNKILHRPTAVLKEARGTHEEPQLVSALRKLFALGEDR
ncbi:MAG: glutamyl-tRNA reductase [Candidatus Binatia bacterium]